MIKNYKIEAFERPVSSLADNPLISAGELKAHFDSNSMELKEALNSVIDEISGETGAENVGFGENSSVSDELVRLENEKASVIAGKGLSSNDYTDNEKLKLAGLPNETYSKTETDGKLENKVDKVSGKGLSSNDYTDAEKTKLGALPANAYSKDEADTLLSAKVNKDGNKVLSDENYTAEEKTKLAGLVQNLPEIAVSEMDTATAGIYRVSRNRTETENSENNSYFELSGGYGILIVENYEYYYQDMKNEDGMYQTLYDADGKVLKRAKYAANDWTDWSEYVPSQSIIQQSYISSVNGNTTTYTFSPQTSASPSAAYKINHTNTETVEFSFSSSLTSSYTNEILIYFKSSLDSAIVWGSGVKFVNDEVPEILADTYYRIVAEYNPLMSKWVIGVICDGTGA